MKKILLIALFVATGVVAQETTTTSAPATTSDSTSTFSFGGLLDDLKKSPASLSFTNEIGVTRGSDRDLDGFYNDFASFLSYKLTDNDSLRFNTGFYSSDTIGKADEKNVQWTGATVRYKRSGILKADKHFVDMSAEIRLNAFNEFWDTEGEKRTGSLSLRGNFTKSLLNDKLFIFSQLRYDEYARTSSVAKIGRRKFAALVAPYWYFAKDWYVSPTVSVNWYHYGDGAKNERKNLVGFAPEVGYSFNKEFSVGAYWDSTPFGSNDGRFFRKQFAESSVFAMYLSYKLF